MLWLHNLGDILIVISDQNDDLKCDNLQNSMIGKN